MKLSLLAVLPFVAAQDDPCNAFTGNMTGCAADPTCMEYPAYCNVVVTVAQTCYNHADQQACDGDTNCLWLPLGSYPGQTTAHCNSDWFLCSGQTAPSCGANCEAGEPQCITTPTTCEDVSDEMPNANSLCTNLGCYSGNECRMKPSMAATCYTLSSEGDCTANSDCQWLPMGSYPEQTQAHCYIGYSCNVHADDTSCTADATCEWASTCEEIPADCQDVDDNAGLCSAAGCFTHETCSPSTEFFQCILAGSDQTTCENTWVGSIQCKFYQPNEMFSNPTAMCYAPVSIWGECSSRENDLAACDAHPYCQRNNDCNQYDCKNQATSGDCAAVDGCFWSDIQGHIVQTLGSGDSFTQSINGNCGECFENEDDPDANTALWMQTLAVPGTCTISGTDSESGATFAGSVTVISAPVVSTGVCQTGAATPPGQNGMVITCAAGTDPPTPSPTYGPLPPLTRYPTAAPTANPTTAPTAAANPTDDSDLSGVAGSVPAVTAVIALCGLWQ